MAGKVKTIATEHIQIFLIITWILSLVIFFQWIDFESLRNDAIMSNGELKLDIPLTHVIDKKYKDKITPNIITHYLILQKENEPSNVKITENILTSYYLPNLPIDSLINNDLSNANVKKKLTYLTSSLIYGKDITLQNLRPFNKNIITDCIDWVVYNINSILYSIVIILVLFVFGDVLHYNNVCYPKKWKTKYDKIYFKTPYIIIASISILGILQAFVVAKLGGIIESPLGITISSIIPVLFYQARYLSSNWEEGTSRVRWKFVYYIPCIVYLITHILAEIHYVAMVDGGIKAFLKVHFGLSYYIILSIAISLGIISMASRKLELAESAT